MFYKCRIDDMKPIERAISAMGNASRLAKSLGVSVQAVCFWRDGKRQIPVEKCSDIERITSGAVTRQDLRPDDWQRIWPELVQPEVAHD